MQSIIVNGWKEFICSLLFACSVGWSSRILRLQPCRGVRPPTPVTRLPAGCGWRLVILWDGILVAEPSTKIATFATLRFGPFLARSVQSAGQVKPYHLYDCLDRILQIAVVANKQTPNPFFQPVAVSQSHKEIQDLECPGCMPRTLKILYFIWW